MTLPSIAIIGGGFSGTALALHLAQAGGFTISIFEPRAEIGRGLAYGSNDPVHRINVPAQRMSLSSDDPEEFLRYLQKNWPQDDPDIYSRNGDAYPRRAVFGDYVHQKVKPLLDKGLLRHYQTMIVKAEQRAGKWLLHQEDGLIHSADILVLAASHPAPALPRPLENLRQDPRLHTEGTSEINLNSTERVLVVGTGLTAADVIAGLLHRGHTGPITAISRRGLRSRGHVSTSSQCEFDFRQKGQTALILLRKLRRQIALARAEAQPWQPIFDQLRAQGQQIWRDLSAKSRRQIVRHLRPYWDVHRFRIAPQVEELLDQALASGQLQLQSAHLRQAQSTKKALIVHLQAKGKDVQAFEFDEIIVTTGPAHGTILQSQKLFSLLAEQGYLTACPTGLGIACDSSARALGSAGQVSPDLYICGPLARGTFGELMGLPQVAQQAQDLAQTLALHAQSFALKPLSFHDMKVLQ